MPTVRKRQTTRRISTEILTRAQLEFLVSGQCLDGDELAKVDGVYMPFLSMESAERTYRKHRAEVFAAAKDRTKSTWRWVDDKHHLHEEPQPLPLGFWEFESTEPKKQLSGPKPLPGHGLWYGEASLFGSFEAAQAAVFETDGQYMGGSSRTGRPTLTKYCQVAL